MQKLRIKFNEIVELHNQGLNIAEIAEKLGCCSSNISHRLKRNNILIKRDYSKVRRTRKGRHKINENFFKSIDNESKAYFLGLMYSDGSVSKNQFYLKLKDEDIIVKFKEALECDYPIIHKEVPFYSYMLEVSSQKSCNYLISQGCVINKTRSIRLPNLKEELYRHFIRGFFDGDGCLQLQDKIYRCRFDLTSASKDFLEQLRPLITREALSNGHLGKEIKYDVWHLNYTGHQIIQILDWLYKDSHFYLKRKYDKYQILKNY